MLMTRIMQHDMHKASRDGLMVPWIELQGLKLPVLISGSRGNFLVARKHHPGDITRVGTFEADSDRIDNYLDGLIHAARDLSREEKWGNEFTGRHAALNGFKHVHDEDNLAQPHIGLFPSAWGEDQVDAFYGKSNLKDGKYRKYCRLFSAPISFPVFCGRPDMVGLYTQFMGGTHSIILHNIKMGMAFMQPD
jgi:hypothetical protein